AWGGKCNARRSGGDGAANGYDPRPIGWGTGEGDREAGGWPTEPLITAEPPACRGTTTADLGGTSSPWSRWGGCRCSGTPTTHGSGSRRAAFRSEEHTSELQSRENLVCRLLL